MIKLINESLKRYTSFKTGGKADLVIIPQNIQEFIEAAKEYPDAFIFGNLSNTLITDKGIRNTVILTTHLNEISVKENEITAMCGTSLSTIAVAAQKASLSGLEFLYGIPGTLGGGIYMNAGAYGGEIGNIIKSVKIYKNKITDLNKSQIEFDYRYSIFQKNGGIILSAVLKAEKGNSKEIRIKMDEIINKRREKQPLEYPSGGSTFKRPIGYFAGKLIEECGLKGKAVGDAEVSHKHAGFIVNKGNAKSSDIIELINIIKTEVYNKTNIMLETEIFIAGEL